MQAILNSEIMGAMPNDEPEGIDRRDVIFYVCMALIFAFAYFAGKYL